jgi:Cu/Ag efflux protein CusF
MKKNEKMTVLKNIKTFAAAILMGLMFVTNAQAQDNQGVTIVASATATATVKKINQKSRKVTVKTADGKDYSFVASSDVTNLPQVKKGDIITIVYAESVAYKIRKHGEAALKTTNVAVVAAPGSKPAGTVAQQSMMSVKITSIDKTKSMVTIVEPQGVSHTINVKDPQILKGLKVGDVVDLTYTEAIAIKVDEATKK